MQDVSKIFLIIAVIVIAYFVYTNYNNGLTENFVDRVGKMVMEPFIGGADDGSESSGEASGVESGVESGDASGVTSGEASSGSSDSPSSSSSGSPNAPQANGSVKANKQVSEVPAVDPTDPVISGKFVNRNTNMSNKYKHASYADKDNFGNSEWLQHFDQVSDLTGNLDKYKNDAFQPNESPNNAQSMQRLYNKKGLEKPEDIFDVDKFLPKDIRDDWFEVMPEPISVKNRHLINISRPIGINTIGNSLRNPSLDIRGCPSNPKTTVSPWLQSTIEPDINIKPLV